MNAEVRQTSAGNYELGAEIDDKWVPFLSLDADTVAGVGVSPAAAEPAATAEPATEAGYTP